MQTFITMNPGNGIETANVAIKRYDTSTAFITMNPGNGIETNRFSIRLLALVFHYNESWQRD
ncbi:MAG: hypothetical protein ACRCU2_13285 [Planktothrix sp.]